VPLGTAPFIAAGIRSAQSDILKQMRAFTLRYL
jgi:hypothetical protein